MAMTAPLSPKSKASGNANIREPRAARPTMGASCQMRSLRCGRSSTSTSPANISSGSGPSSVTLGVSSGPSELRRSVSCSGPSSCPGSSRSAVM